MKELSEEEYDELDEYFTHNTIMPDTGKPGYFARKYGMLIRLDPETTRFLATQAENTHKSCTEIIGELVREKIATSL